MTRGWIFDLYPGGPGELVVWLKQEDGRTLRLVDRWSPSLFVAADDHRLLKAVAESGDVRAYASGVRLVQRHEKVTDRSPRDVLEVVARDAKKLVELARRIERAHPFGSVRIYNCDVPPAQSYLYEHDLFPLALCDVSEGPAGLAWRLRDDTWKFDYSVPPLRTKRLALSVRKSGRIAKVGDPIDEIWLQDECEEGRELMEGATEAEKILRLVERVRESDPDILLTRDGDTFLFPYLIARAAANGLGDRLALGRDPDVLRLPDRPGTSYFSYGKILFKPSSVKLHGRVHLDAGSSFSYSESGIDGLFELSRVCRQPLHTSSRASIGKALSSLQFYHATKKDVLIPWKPSLAERFKDRSELLVADRGGFIFEPHAGVYDQVGELDFSSLFPNIMLKKNISAETVGCSCCPDSENIVPELGWHVCERQGITAQSMEVIVKKRLEYKKRKKDASKEDMERYDGRQAVLKWLGVTCLPRESPVFVNHGGKDRLVSIGDFIDGLLGERTGAIECPPGVFVAGLGRDLKAKYSRVTNLIKKPNNQNLLSVEMEDGRKIVTTPDHPFFTLREGELKVTAADQLEVGEAIPIARKIPSATNAIERIDLIEQLGKSLNVEEQRLWRVSGERLKEEIRARKQILLKAALSEGYSYQAVVAWIKSGIIPLRFLGLIETSAFHEELRIGVGRRLGGRMAWLPAVIKIDEKFGFFLGLYVADGSATKTYVRLDIATIEPELLKIAKESVESMFGIAPRIYKERKAQMNVVQANSASLVRVLEKVFGLPGSAEKGKLNVPDVMFNCKELVAHRFIAGLMAGDGHASRMRKFVNIATASKDFQNQVAFLAARLGLTFRLATQREWGNSLYTVNFVGPETMGSIASWEYSKENQRPTIQAWSKESPDTCNHPRYVRLPASESGLFTLAKTTRTSSRPHVQEGARTCPVQAKKKLGRVHSRRLSGVQKEQMSKIDRLLHCDLGFVRIRKIERLDSRPEYVYCFQLADDELPGFFTGEGLVFTHNCFGYLGYNNAKFGRIDAHIAVCAWDRWVLLESMRVAERRGFRVVHGIVDSLWLRKAGAGRAEYEDLKGEIERETGFELSFEGIYDWIAFLNSRTDPRLAVQNQYFGSYGDGKGTKARGIEARRHDTPALFRACQDAVLKVMSEAGSVAEVRAAIPSCIDVFCGYARMVRRREVPEEEMVFTRNISKNPQEYHRGTVEAGVVRALLEEGASLHQGESIRYVITDYYAKTGRALPVEALDGKRCYDTRRYVELLAESCATLLQPFDRRMTQEGLLEIARRDEVWSFAS